MASRIFYDQLKGKGDQLLRYPPSPPKDLSPPQQVCPIAAGPCGSTPGNHLLT